MDWERSSCSDPTLTACLAVAWLAWLVRCARLDWVPPRRRLLLSLPVHLDPVGGDAFRAVQPLHRRYEGVHAVRLVIHHAHEGVDHPLLALHHPGFVFSRGQAAGVRY